jgi:oligopeptide/dipeptide ABC transporter ATP-binding protein
MPGEPLLEVHDLSVEYPSDTGGWRKVVDGFSLEISAGERIGLVGESGSGKSVAALGMLCLVRAPGRIRGGAVTLAGKHPNGPSAELWRHIRGHDVGYVFQEPTTALNPVYTIGFQLAETVRVHRDISSDAVRSEAASLLADVGLTDAERISRSYPHQLSGGQLQRVGMALALAGAPRLVIADEPTTDLDVIQQATILELLKRLCDRDGLGLLVISHDLAVVAGLVKLVVVMFAGLVVELAPTVDLFENPLHPYSQLLLEAARGPEPRASSGGVGIPGPAAAGCPFAPRCSLANDGCARKTPKLIRAATDRSVRCPVTLEDTHAPAETKALR